MGANVKVQVKLPDGRPAAGAQIHGVNHDAWSKAHQEWQGTTDDHGTHTWANMDTGTLGDRYTFSANHTDDQGGRWLGEVSERIRKDMEITIVLAKAPDVARSPESPEPSGPGAAST